MRLLLQQHTDNCAIQCCAERAGLEEIFPGLVPSTRPATKRRTRLLDVKASGKSRQKGVQEEQGKVCYCRKRLMQEVFQKRFCCLTREKHSQNDAWFV